MVVGTNPYWSCSRVPYVYLDPLKTPEPNRDGQLKDQYSMPFAATFDEQDNLYVADMNWARILVYKKPLTAVTPAPVGGVAELPDSPNAPQTAATSSPGRFQPGRPSPVSRRRGLVASGAGGWYAKKRWLP